MLSDEDRVFCENKTDWQSLLCEKYTITETLNVKTVDNGVLLPLKQIPPFEGHPSTYAGGVCDNKMNFVAGSQPYIRAFCCKQSYYIEKKHINISNDEVVFGGVFYQQFGVMLLLSLTRLWWFVKNKTKKQKIVFLAEEYNKEIATKNCENIARILGINNWDIVEEPTQYSRIIVPDEAFLGNNSISKDLFLTYDLLKKNVQDENFKKHDKLYLTRRFFKKIGNNSDGVNEEYYENFYIKRGFYVFSPEALDLKEQIFLISNAKEVVSTYGTIAHLVTFFINDKCRQIMLLRANVPDTWVKFELAILRARNIDWYLIEATKNALPTRHDGGVFLYMPTKSFKDFLELTQQAYNKNELDEKITNNIMSKYMSLWANKYANVKNFHLLRNPGVFPLLQSLYFQSTGKKLDPKDFLE